MEENIEQWEEVIDLTKIDEIAELLKEEGTKMFHNLLDGLDGVGVNLEDPLHMLMFIKKFDAGLFEETFHPNRSKNGKFSIQFYTDMGLLTKIWQKKQLMK